MSAGARHQLGSSPITAARHHRHASIDDNLQAAFSAEEASPVHAVLHEPSESDIEPQQASPPMPLPQNITGMPFLSSSATWSFEGGIVAF